jgi:hypothetical protein
MDTRPQISDAAQERALGYLRDVARRGGVIRDENGGTRRLNNSAFIEELRYDYEFRLQDFYMENGIGSQFLGKLSRLEDESDRGMISVLVCSEKNRSLGGDIMPGDGFFTLAQELMTLPRNEARPNWLPQNPTEDQKEAFWNREFREVCAANGFVDTDAH